MPSKSLFVQAFAKDGPFEVFFCDCNNCQTDGKGWVVRRVETKDFITAVNYRHRRSAERRVEQLNLAYAERIMVQP
jgi:hypothetical protein